MIKKVIKIIKNSTFNDEVYLSWFDMQKPNLTAVSKNGVNFIVKVKFTHLHEDDVLLCEDGTKIKVNRSNDLVYTLSFKQEEDFAKIAYEVGNRHQAISIEFMKITVLDDVSLKDIIKSANKNPNIKVHKKYEYFKANAKAHHSH